MGLVNTMNAQWIAWSLVLLAGINSCIGNLLLKKSRLVATDGGLFALLLSPWFLGGLFFYGINVILFAKALERLPVSQAYPVLAGSGFALLVFSAAWIFGERLGPSQWAGMFAVLLGIYLLSRT
jgi:multidrug transporter EmrE-like cation transporter